MIVKRYCFQCRDTQLHKRSKSYQRGQVVVGEWSCLCCQAKREEAIRQPYGYAPDGETSITLVSPSSIAVS